MTHVPRWRCERVGDLRGAELDAYRHMTDVDLRRAWEPDAGVFMAEGLLVIERAVRTGLEVQSVLTAPRWLDRLTGVLGDWDGVVYVADEELLRDLTGYRVHRGALACVRRPPPLHIADVIGLDGDLLVLGDLVDHTNVGLAFRSAAALGIVGVILSPVCADPLYRRSVKSSMGAVLAIPWARARAWPGCLHDLGGRHTIALTPDPNAAPLAQALAGHGGRRTALVVGAEGPGLGLDELAACEVRAGIPMQSGIDSLNVAAAVAVACYALGMERQR